MDSLIQLNIDLSKDIVFGDLMNLVYLTVPFVLFFMIITIIYFTGLDKHTLKVFNEKGKKDKGASSMPGRRLMSLFYILFFLILISIVIQFSAAFLQEYDKLNNETAARLFSNIDFNPVPFGILINSITICTMLFTGVEGSVASISTFHMGKGKMEKMSPIKRTRVYTVVYLWLYLTIIALLYHFLIGSSIVNFQLENFFVGLSTAIVLLFAGDKAPNILKDFGKGFDPKSFTEGYEEDKKNKNDKDKENNDGKNVTTVTTKTTKTTTRKRQNKKQDECDNGCEGDEVAISEVGPPPTMK